MTDNTFICYRCGRHFPEAVKRRRNVYAGLFGLSTIRVDLCPECEAHYIHGERAVLFGAIIFVIGLIAFFWWLNL